MDRQEPTRPRRRATVILAMAVVCAAMAPARAAGESTPTEAPLRNQDVVMMIVQGVSADTVIERIRARPPAFDLSDEMLREMAIAGVPEAVLRAMRDRQQRHDRAAESASDPTAADSGAASEDTTSPGGIRLRIVDADASDPVESPARIRVARVAPEAIAEQLSLERSPEARAIDGVALVVLCIEARHVPDHWRSASPLGRDFLWTPRHRMLGFVAAESDGGDGPPDDTEAYVFPRDVDVAVEGPGHGVVVGVALRIGGRWYLARSVEAGPLDVPEAGLERIVRIRQGPEAGFVLDVEIVAVDDAS